MRQVADARRASRCLFRGCGPGIARGALGLLWLGALTWSALAFAQPRSGGDDESTRWRSQFHAEVDRRLDVPVVDQRRYMVLLLQALTEAATPVQGAQAFVLVDRSPQVQAAFVVIRTATGDWQWTGASPVSTGKVGTFDHFVTPLGVFAHTLANPDFRAEGSFNENHIRGYGLRGRRVFDFGWAIAARGWGAGGTSQMRLQMHATDPDVLEAKLGRVESKGCIRIPSTLNVFLDRHGILDADYEAARAGGKSLWVLGHDREPIAWPGHYLVIIDSMTAERPAWSPLPGAKQAPVTETPEINPAAIPASSDRTLAEDTHPPDGVAPTRARLSPMAAEDRMPGTSRLR